MNPKVTELERLVGQRQGAGDAPVDLICLSHLRWDFVYQRPQHLLSRCARQRRVFFFEEPIIDAEEPRLELSQRDCGVWVAVPHFPAGMSAEQMEAAQRVLLDEMIEECHIDEYILWYYTAMAIPFSRHLEPLAVVYDCMDELSAFRGAPPALKMREQELFSRADLVFTGGQSLYEVKCKQHPNVYAFPSSIDREHFAQARTITTDPEDQASIPYPRMGFCGVIDERMNIELLGRMADLRPNWHFVMIGPVVKIDPADLPRRDNIHYLGPKAYGELPQYLAGWTVAMLPFALNESTRFISPTKTPEYLAAGKPVVSTSIRDVVRPYGDRGMVRIADTAEEFVAAAGELGMEMISDLSGWWNKVDGFLAQTSWDRTWDLMAQLIDSVVNSSLARIRRRHAGLPAEPAAAEPATGVTDASLSMNQQPQ
jgi:UDP-galactopyranose mutase